MFVSSLPPQLYCVTLITVYNSFSKEEQFEIYYSACAAAAQFHSTRQRFIKVTNCDVEMQLQEEEEAKAYVHALSIG